MRIGYDHGSGKLAGSLDNIRIYNRVLSPTELGQLYVSESPAGRNLLVNGGFENSADHGAQTVNTFDPAVDGWISRSNGNFGTYRLGDLNVGNTLAQLGQRQLGFNTGQTAPNAWIEQAVAVQPGSTYRLSFYSSRSGHPDFQGGAIRSLILDGSRSVLSSNTVITDQTVGAVEPNHPVRHGDRQQSHRAV